jgi:hypothetical protein
MPRLNGLRHKGAAQEPGAPSAQDKCRALGVAGSNVPATAG